VHEQRASEYTALLAEGLSLREIARRYGTSHSAVAYAVRNY
jgi:DNA-binding CsgD family transcriptional regulator